MTLSSIAIRRPVFTVMVTAAIFVLGIVGLRDLGTDLFPDISFPVVSVAIPYPGASPSEVETLVTRPVEDAVIGLGGIDRVRSFSREGVSSTVVIFQLGVDLAEASTEVRERVAQNRYKFPQETKEPMISRFDVSSAPVLTFTVQGKGSLSATRTFAEDVLKPALEQINGVAMIDIQGGAKREVHVDLDRAKLAALGLAPSGVVQRLRAANLNVPAGHFKEGAREISVRTLGELADVEAIRNLPMVTDAEGSSVLLRDIASVTDGFQEQRTTVRVNGQEAVTVDVLKQSGQNTVAIAEAVQARLREMAPSFPAGTETAVMVDQAKYIQRSIDQVKHDIVFGGGMAILIILLFMLDLRSTLISAVALPTSVVGTFFLMYLCGYTLNMMTLLGLSLAIGLLIDDAVVVRENIFKHLERGKSPFQAALDGTEEIALSVLATTLTIVAVFLPVAFVKGVVGQFFRQFGITVSGAVMLSLFVAFTLDPMLSARFSKQLDPKHDRFRALKAPFERFFAAMEQTYRTCLQFALQHKGKVGLGAVLSLVFAGWIATLTGSEFVNAEDRGQFVLEMELAAGTSLEETGRVSMEGEKRLLQDPEVRTVLAMLGPMEEVNKVRWRVVTSSKTERDIPLSVLKDRARKIAQSTAPSAKIVLTDPPFVEGAGTEAPIMIDVRGETYADISPLANQVADILRETSGVQDVQVRYSPGRPELQIEVDRARAADRGLWMAPLALALRTAVDGEEAGSLRQGKNEIPIRVRLEARDRDAAEVLGHLPLPSPRGKVELTDVATLRRGEGPQVIERENRSRQIQVWASPVGRPLGEIVQEIMPRLSSLSKPPGASFVYDGQIRMMNETNSNMGFALLLGVVFIYLLLASQFESFVHPLTIMLTLPLALVGAILALFLTHTTLAMGAMIGIILLMGLVTKNAILLVDCAIVRVREHGESPMQAILEAGPERLRPILMTSAAVILGMLPTAMGHAEGSEFRAPMAIAVIGGVISSTLLSLLVVPAFYLAIENFKAKRFKPSVLPSLLGLLLVLGMPQAHAAAQELLTAPPVRTEASLLKEDLSRLWSPGGLTADLVAQKALQVSFALKAKTSELQAAQEKVAQAKLHFLPTVSGQGRYTRLSPVAPVMMGQGSMVFSKESVSAPTQVQRLDELIKIPPFSFPMLNNQTEFKATLQVPLSDFVFRLGHALAAASRSEKAVQADLQAAQRKVEADARLLYYQWIKALAQQRVAEQSLQQAHEHARDAHTLFRAETILRAELLKAEVQVKTAELLVDRARHAVEWSVEQLRSSMHDPDKTSYRVGEDVLTVLPSVAEEDLESLHQEALGKRPEIRALDETAWSLAAQKRAGVMTILPRLDVAANATYANPNLRIFPQEPKFLGTWDVSLVLSWVPSDFFATASRLRELDAHRAGIFAQKGALSEGLRLEVQQARQALQEVHAALGITTQGLAAAEEAYRVRHVLFQSGRTTFTELIDAQTDLTRARLEWVSAHLDDHMARVRFAHAVGRAYGVSS